MYGCRIGHVQVDAKLSSPGLEPGDAVVAHFPTDCNRNTRAKRRSLFLSVGQIIGSGSSRVIKEEWRPTNWHGRIHLFGHRPCDTVGNICGKSARRLNITGLRNGLTLQIH